MSWANATARFSNDSDSFASWTTTSQTKWLNTTKPRPVNLWWKPLALPIASFDCPFSLIYKKQATIHRVAAAATLWMILHTVDLQTKQITNDQLPHAKKRNATRTCRVVVVSDPFRLLILMLSSTISTKSMISWRRNRYLSNTSNGRSASLNISFSAIQSLLHDFVDELIAMQPSTRPDLVWSS